MFLAFCLCLTLSAPQDPRDRWVGEDKLKHLLASFAATSLAAGAARAAGMDPIPSAWVGAGVGVGLGVAKEARDLRAPGSTPSLRDLAWDLAGVGAATALAREVR